MRESKGAATMSTKTRKAARKRPTKKFPVKPGRRANEAENRPELKKKIEMPAETAKAMLERSPRQENL
jgi:hypothetical protein